jgi:DNA-binding transcriptional ArsR family regulator
LTNAKICAILYLTKKLNIKEAFNLGIQLTIKALSDPIRREILEMLKAGRLPAGEIANHFSVSGAAVSKHLAVLREADLIRDAREGKYIFYELNTSVLEEVMLWLTSLKGEKND